MNDMTSTNISFLRHEFAPTGKIRVSINLGNPILAKRENCTGRLFGVSVDLANELSNRLGIEAELLAFDAAGKAVEAMRAGMVDIGFFAIDPARSQGIQFTPPYVQIEGAYLVRDGSPLRHNADVDMTGTRVAVGAGSAYDLFLTRALKNAQIVRASTSPAVVDFFLEKNLDVAAGVKQQLEADAQRVGGTRLIPGCFMVIHQAMGLPASRSEEAVAYLASFIEEMTASGFILQALARHRIEGAVVAPATSTLHGSTRTCRRRTH